MPILFSPPKWFSGRLETPTLWDSRWLSTLTWHNLDVVAVRDEQVSSWMPKYLERQRIAVAARAKPVEAVIDFYRGKTAGSPSNVGPYLSPTLGMQQKPCVLCAFAFVG